MNENLTLQNLLMSIQLVSRFGESSCRVLTITMYWKPLLPLLPSVSEAPTSSQLSFFWEVCHDIPPVLWSLSPGQASAVVPTTPTL